MKLLQNNMIRIIPFLVIAVLAIGLRAYHISAPIADWHSFRQVDTASVARRYTVEGINLFVPRYDDLSNIQSGKDNPEGYRMVEFPLYQGAAAWLYTMTNRGTIELWLRILTIACSTATALLLGWWVGRRVSYLGGVATAFFYAVLPYSMFYGRVVLPDPSMVFWSVASLCLLDLFVQKPKVLWFIGSVLCAALALLTKPVAAFLFFPIPFMLLGQKKSLVKKVGECILWGGIALTPLVMWRGWIVRFPEGIPASDWLFNNNNIRLKGAWFQWLFADRIGRLILGYWGLILLGIGCIIKKSTKEGSVFVWLFIGSLAYLVVIAGGNVQHDYYQILLLPVLTIYMGKGVASLWENKHFTRVGSILVGTVSIAFMLAFSWYSIRSYYWINRPEIIEAGKQADALLPSDAKVIAPYNGDTTFLYQTKRSGWPLGFDIDQKIAMGATHYVTVSPTDNDLETRDLARMYTVLVRNEKFAIIDLTKKK